MRRLSLALAATAAALAFSAPSANAVVAVPTLGQLCQNGNTNAQTLALPGFQALFPLGTLCDTLALRRCLNSISNQFPGGVGFTPCVKQIL